MVRPKVAAYKSHGHLIGKDVKKLAEKDRKARDLRQAEYIAKEFFGKGKNQSKKGGRY